MAKVADAFDRRERRARQPTSLFRAYATPMNRENARRIERSFAQDQLVSEFARRQLAAASKCRRSLELLRAPPFRLLQHKKHLCLLRKRSFCSAKHAACQRIIGRDCRADRR